MNPGGTITSYFGDASGLYHDIRAADGGFTFFDVSGAGTGPGQGTEPFSLNASGDVVGAYVDANGTSRGFLRTRNGAITTFEAPGAGTGSGQGTLPFFNTAANAIVGVWFDANGVAHGFLRTSPR